MRVMYEGASHRQKTSLTREFDWLIRKIPAGATYSEIIPFTMSASITVSMPDEMDGTHIAIYNAFEDGGVPRPVYDRDNDLLIVTFRASATVVLPADCFPLGYIYLASASNAAGALQVESAERTFVITLKP